MSKGLENSKEFVFENERTEMILHQQAIDPKECVRPIEDCEFCKHRPSCREIALGRIKSVDFEKIRKEAELNSLGSLPNESNYTPDK